MNNFPLNVDAFMPVIPPYSGGAVAPIVTGDSRSQALFACLLLVAMVLGFGSPAQASVIDFESANPNFCGYEIWSGGFIFQNAYNKPALCRENALSQELIHYEGSAYMDMTIIMYSAQTPQPNLTPFSLNSFEVNEYAYYPGQYVTYPPYFDRTAILDITCLSGNGDVNLTVTLDGLPGKQTVYLPNTCTNLSRVYFDTSNTNRAWYYLDNIRVNETFGPPPVVPIPPAVWLFGSAVGLMGVMRRKISS